MTSGQRVGDIQGPIIVATVPEYGRERHGLSVRSISRLGL